MHLHTSCHFASNVEGAARSQLVAKLSFPYIVDHSRTTRSFGLGTIFQKIINKEIPADIVFEDEHCLAFRDINPQAPVHLLLIPKKEIPTLQDVSSDDRELMGHMTALIPDLAKKEGLENDGYRVVINCKDNGGQEVYHLHYHILGGRSLKWPPG